MRRRDFNVGFKESEGAAKEHEESMGDGIEGLEEELEAMGKRVRKGEEDLGNGGAKEKERDLAVG